MISQIVFLAFFALSSAAENNPEIEKERTINGLELELDEFLAEMLSEITGIIDKAMHGAGTIGFFLAMAALAVLTSFIFRDHLLSIMNRRNFELGNPLRADYQKGHISEDQYLKNRFKRFATNGKVFLIFSLSY